MELNIKEQIRPVSDFRKDTAQMLKKLKENHHPIILTQRGRSVAVIVDVDTYESLDYENRLRQAYAEGIRDSEQGRTFPHEKVMKEVRELIKRKKTK
jgi:antitoxin YefM